ncbi:polyprenyl diphosphate synthase [Rickettsia endosymbiont of Cardiosporidium cionae]|uniref:polyprenyl diphosphate synthase n=1 Tax=Rickettsia endosymbiont of Cardiosporidium cionae TaxID=2777155 RepID=UPI0018945046|nr:polyprenyl diphosphate synthase [Rickettsia endosymbiont of Cardiosporidium cionae]KAF8818538.1 di-trans,poly-cis-decaprenylcistransferase [Rickettsia endosymbiont of Cardiosporidium cionae]
MNKFNRDIKHLAIIMDGNSRWTEYYGYKKFYGYIKGVETLDLILSTLIDVNISYVTLYAFSSENRKRPKKEVHFLMNLFNEYIEYNIKKFVEKDIKVKILGKIVTLDRRSRLNIQKITDSTFNNNGITLCIAWNYGGREEIIDACQKILDVGSQQKITEEYFQKYLYDSEMPDVDLLIRTGGRHRISNFLLWQSAYAEFYFLDKYWPDFNKQDLINAIKYYLSKSRTFGKR